MIKAYEDDGIGQTILGFGLARWVSYSDILARKFRQQYSRSRDFSCGGRNITDNSAQLYQY